jgi:hypothetical protein
LAEAYQLAMEKENRAAHAGNTFVDLATFKRARA